MSVSDSSDQHSSHNGEDPIHEANSAAAAATQNQATRDQATRDQAKEPQHATQDQATAPQHATQDQATAPQHATTQDEDTEQREYAVVAKNLSLSGEEGPVYGPLTFNVPASGLTILSGSGGGGRTALALTLAGRMKPDSGELRVLGYDKRADIRNRVAIAGVEQVDLLDRDVKVQTLLTEHLNWSRPWWSLSKKADEEYLEYIARNVYGPRSLPPLTAYVSDLPGVDKHLLRMALALHPANGHDIELLVVDDLEQIHEIADQYLLLTRLEEIAREIPVIVNAVNPVPPDLIAIQKVIELDTESGHVQPEHTGYSTIRMLKKATGAFEKRAERKAAHADNSRNTPATNTPTTNSPATNTPATNTPTANTPAPQEGEE